MKFCGALRRRSRQILGATLATTGGGGGGGTLFEYVNGPSLRIGADRDLRADGVLDAVDARSFAGPTQERHLGGILNVWGYEKI